MSEQPEPVRPLEALDLPVVLLSHRGPVSFRRTEDRRTASRGAGGLVSALTGLAEHLAEAVWISAATTDEDRAVMAESDGEPVQVSLRPTPRLMADAPEADAGPTMQVVMVDVDPGRHHDFYSVIANPLLWFIQHGLYGLSTAPQLTARDHEAFANYVAVNELFADAVVERVQSYGGKALVMLHDYHFYLVADRVRERCPDARITHFTHIPWPGPDAWRILPPAMRNAIFRGVLGNDVVAFHTVRYARNFVLCCQELLGFTCDLDAMTVHVDGREVRARYYPISIDVGALEDLVATKEVAANVGTLTDRYLSGGGQLILRVDRTDPSKNIVRGFRAFDTLLTDHPELVGRVVFFALLQPSRQDVPEYADYIAAIGGVVAEVNARHGIGGWQPIILRLEDDLPLAVAAYGVCDVLMVNALNDGMNLVAKEAVIANTRDGVLALSENTGAYEELGRFAVTLYPFDVQQQADALHDALTMAPELRRDLRAAAAEVVRRNDVGRWFGAQISDVLGLPAAIE
ncbi:MAG: alpha,alpha-trehalose-phosphate synthase (UDP-forming) [Mycobacteriales bacterium]